MTKTWTRRRALGAGAGTALLPLVHMRTAAAAGKLSIAFWDHWVPQGNEVMRKQVQTWADKNKVEVTADFVTSNGNKLLMTIAAEAQGGAGHDCIALATWQVHQYADKLAPVDDVMQDLTGKYGQTNEVCEYLGRVHNQWRAVPTSSGTQIKGPCGRISLLRDHAGLDVVGMYPAKPEHTAAADGWTYEAMLGPMAACQKAGVPFGIGLGLTADSTDTAGVMFAAFGAELVDVEGNLKVRSDPVRHLLEYAQQFVKFLPENTISFDDASNNRALISGKSALIFNPPSAWAVAKRDNPAIAADCWTFPAPAGPNGRFTPYLPFFWGIWSFSRNQSAGRELIAYLCERAQVEERCAAVQGYDLPPFSGMADLKIWDTVGPPPGTLYNYPLRPWHNTRPHVAASWAAPEVAAQIYFRGTLATMLAKLRSGGTITQAMDWAEAEVAGFLR